VFPGACDPAQARFKESLMCSTLTLQHKARNDGNSQRRRGIEYMYILLLFNLVQSNWLTPLARDFGMDAGKRKGGGGKGEIGKERQQVEVGDGT